MLKYLIRFVVFILAALIGTTLTETRNSIYKKPTWPVAEIQIKGAIMPGPALSESEEDEFLPTSLSPNDIESFINNHPSANLTKLWQALRINPNTFQDQDVNGPYFPRSCDNCSAESFEYDLDGEPGAEVLLKIARPWDPAARYLIFKYASNAWKLLGHIDASGKYRMPQHAVILSGGLTWLAIRSQGASGTGVASYFDSVYLVTPRGLLAAFNYMADGSQYGGPNSANREFNGRILDCSLRNNVVTVEMEYSVTYVGSKNILFRKKQKAVFYTGLGNKSERFDQTRSDLSKEELDAVYNIDTLSDEAFLQYNYKELSEIATGSNSTRKPWLRQFLLSCANTAEHRRLSRMLSQ